MEAKSTDSKTHVLPDETDPEITFSATKTEVPEKETPREDVATTPTATEAKTEMEQQATEIAGADRRRSNKSRTGKTRRHSFVNRGTAKVAKPGTNRHKYPFRPGIVWEEGARLEAKDFQKKWYPARIVEIEDSEQSVLIHFDGWNQRYDEWLPMASDRMRPMARHSSRTIKAKPNVPHIRANTSPTEKKLPPGRHGPRKKLMEPTAGEEPLPPHGIPNRPWAKEHKVGENVFAKWTDCRMYPARIMAVNPNGTYDVVFYDGFRKVVQPINIRPIPADVQANYAAAGVLPEAGKKMKVNMRDLQKELEGKRVVASHHRRDRKQHRASTETTTAPSSGDHEQRDGMEEPDDGTRESGNVQAAMKTQRSQSKSSEDGRVDGTPTTSRVGKGAQRRDKRRRSSANKKPAASSTPKPPSSEPLPELQPQPQQEPGPSSEPTEPEPNPVRGAGSETGTGGEMAAMAGNAATPIPSLIPSLSSGSASQSETHTPESSRTSTPITTPITTPQVTPQLTPQVTPGSSCAPTPEQLSAGRKSSLHGADEEWSCPSCSKVFRKEALLDCHVKYYHNAEDGGMGQGRKRRKTVSMCSTESEMSVGGKRGKDTPSTVLGMESLTTSTQDSAPSLSIDGDDFNLVEEVVTTTAEEGGGGGGELVPLMSATPHHMEEEEEEEEDPKDRLTKDEVVNCICQLNEENGLMIQCEVCLCWQHANCMDITEDTLPAKYICYVCLNPPGVRENAKYSYDQDWLNRGYLARFGFLPDDRLATRKADIMQATHSLVGDVHNAAAVLRALDSNIHVLHNPIANPQVSFWKKDWDAVMEQLAAQQRFPKLRGRDFSPSPSPSRSPSPSATSTSTKTEIKDDPGAESDTTIEMDPSEYAKLGKARKSISPEPPRTQNETPRTQIESPRTQNNPNSNQTGNAMGNMSSAVNVSSASMSESGEEKPELGASIKQEVLEPDEASLGLGLDLEVKMEENVELFVPDSMQEVTVKVEEGEDEESCRWRLVRHIESTQDALEQRLDLIEQQVTELEVANTTENGKNSDALRDIPKVKMAVHLLLSDLTRVQRMAMYH